MSAVLEKNLELNGQVDEVYQFIADPASWALWPSTGKVPGIVSASGRVVQGEYVKFKTTDGSEHEHFVAELIPTQRIRLQLKKVGLPLALFIAEIQDCFDFEPTETGTRMRRRFEIRFRSNVIAETIGRALFTQHFSQALDAHHSRLVEKFSK
ncbi:MAG: hypothetical protein NDI61_07375 [Bdellovibrionaceae bacterium]|nr:hypothetical protein [Pseudobdellovibrionaceae bacterium]